MAILQIFGDSRSGNCLKVRWTAERLGVAYAWIEVEVLSGRTRSAAFLAINPAGQVPTVILPDGRVLAQSNAIIQYLAEGSDLIPADRYDRARMSEWMFWEQYSHEPCIAVARYHRLFLGKPPEAIDPKLMERGEAALARMELGLADGPFLVGARLSLADIALVAYTRVAHEGGFSLGPYPRVEAWVARVQNELGL